jgi:hypothetical protein
MFAKSDSYDFTASACFGDRFFEVPSRGSPYMCTALHLREAETEINALEVHGPDIFCDQLSLVSHAVSPWLSSAQYAPPRGNPARAGCRSRATVKKACGMIPWIWCSHAVPRERFARITGECELFPFARLVMVECQHTLVTLNVSNASWLM